MGGEQAGGRWEVVVVKLENSRPRSYSTWRGDARECPLG